jgi:glycosyltransferase involved in cell wall biosynthesis
MNFANKDINPSTAITASKASKALIITYYWPPSGGAGVQRWLKFAKYLPESGWEPVILTVDPDYAAYPVTDSSLEKEIPASLRVFKTRATDYFSVYKKDKSKIPTAGFANSVNNTLKGKIMRFIRGNFFIPDPRKGWNKYAFKKACELIETEGIQHVITTSPPHSTQLIGLKLKSKYPSITWTADLRDPWTDIYYYDLFYPTFISKSIDSALEKKVLRAADRIITVGKSLMESFISKEASVRDKTSVIPNGYDEDDFKNLKFSTPDKFTISYTGTLSDTYPVNGFLEALTLFKSNGNDFFVRFVGTVSTDQQKLILSKAGNENVEFISYTDHTTAINYMAQSSLLLLIIPEHKSNKSIITGKIFEYLATGKPVLCLGPADGDAATIIDSVNAGLTVGYSDIPGIMNYLKKASSGLAFRSNEGKLKYSRKELTKKIFAQ